MERKEAADKGCLACSFPFWDKLTDAQQDFLCRFARPVHYDKGAHVHSPTENCVGILLLRSGQLRAYLLTDEGRELTLYRLFPRDMCLFSASCVLRGIQFDVLVEAERDTVALFLPAQVYQGLMEESAAVANFTNELMADRFSEVMRRMDQLLSKKLDVRLAALLVEESRLAESSTLRLTHDRLARHLGSAREVVTRLLKDFQADGLVRLSRGGVELLLGAGISAAAIRRIRESLPQARAFHMSGKITVESPMSYRKGDVSMGLPGFDEYTLWRTDPENLRAARKELME